jgi:hypothetical protein
MSREIELLSKVFIAIAAAAALTSCIVVTAADYQKYLDSYVGSPESALTSAWGPPSAIRESGNSRLLTYVRDTQTEQQNAEGVTTDIIHHKCTTTFTVTDGKVISWDYRGDTCTLTLPASYGR